MRISESLKKNGDFKRVYEKGTSRADRYLVMYVLKGEKGRNRLGISVSKKVGNSVVRHRLTRLVREAYRLNEERFKAGYDITVICRMSAKGRSYKEIEDSLLYLAEKNEVIL